MNGQLFVGEVRSENGNANYHRYNWQFGNRLCVFSAKYIEEFIEELRLRFGLPYPFQGDDFAAKLTISPIMGNECIQIGCLR